MPTEMCANTLGFCHSGPQLVKCGLTSRWQCVATDSHSSLTSVDSTEQASPFSLVISLYEWLAD